MSEPSPLPAEEYEYHSDDEAAATPQDENLSIPGSGAPSSRSPYHLPASEQLRGVANRIIFSRYYIFFYLVMMSLSLTTVVLSLIATRGSGEFHQMQHHQPCCEHADRLALTSR